MAKTPTWLQPEVTSKSAHHGLLQLRSLLESTAAASPARSEAGAEGHGVEMSLKFSTRDAEDKCYAAPSVLHCLDRREASEH
ncbi:hypothetical protein E2C01_051767 [Portunus trituberculatus]|uniref:Uncharacterized protein n=1 Tax=Portunus trituberculatus TaxID=210409 RepID=A0A5B7GJP4_PORTR|nr:hypothetical protein [Portunus trituberculatus]